MACVLVLNCGSSSIKYQLVEPDSAEVFAAGLIERVTDHAEGLRAAFDEIAAAGHDLAHVGLRAVGHRVVHGGEEFYEPTLIDDQVLETIARLSALAPLHNPANVTGIESARKLLPDVAQVAVFDTAFFHGLPLAARTYAIDADMAAANGIRRYGFHGTSHEYVSGEVARFLGNDALHQIVLHLGNGASASAVKGGKPIDTTMGLTPLEGLVMGTRSGDIDPGIVMHLRRNAGMTVDAIDDLLNRRSGLKGLSGVNDFRELRALIDGGDAAAQLAYDVYIHRLRRYIGAYLLELGGADVITFTAGVGENSVEVRRDALAGLERLGIVVDPERNSARSRVARVISTDDSAISVLVVPTNEELAIARGASRLVSTS